MGRDLFEDAVDDALSGEMLRLAEDPLEATLAELLALGALGFREAVREEQQRGAGREVLVSALVGGVGDRPLR